MIRNIETGDSHFLYEVSRPVTWPLTDEVKGVIQDLKDTLDATKHATGVAAPQIGSNVNIIIYRTDKVKPTIMINPRIVKARDMETTPKFEMCLSFPQQIYSVKRYKNISVYFEDESGDSYVLKYRGLEARILQHETDHLIGMNIPQRGDKLDEATTLALLGGLRESKNGKEED